MIFCNLRRVLIALLVSAFLPAAAMAAEGKRFYGSISGVYAIPLDSTVSQEILGHDASTKISMDGGIGVLAAIGYEVSEGLAVELEFGYRGFSFDKASGLDVSGPDVNDTYDIEGGVKGDISTLSLMLNGIYTFREWNVQPYIGLGIGMARHNAEIDEISIEEGGTTYTYGFEGSEDAYVFAYQAMAGVSYPVSNAFAVRAGYRYFATSEAGFRRLHGDLRDAQFRGWGSVPVLEKYPSAVVTGRGVNHPRKEKLP